MKEREILTTSRQKSPKNDYKEQEKTDREELKLKNKCEKDDQKITRERKKRE